MEPVLLCLGEALVDIVHQGGSTLEHVGGSPLNVACGLSRLGHRTALAAWWGRDERGARIARHCADKGVEVVPGSNGAERTSIADAQIDAGGQASYTFDLLWQLPEPIDLTEVGHVHTGSIAATLEPGGSQVLDVLSRARGHASTSYDPNARPTIMGVPEQVLDRIEACISASDVVKASDEDVAWLYPGMTVDEVLRHWLSLGASLAVVTRGGEGAIARLTGQAEPMAIASRTVDLVDTVGAGDSFMAGLLSGLTDAGLLGSRAAADRLRRAGWGDVRPALERARNTSGVTVEHAGAYSPTRQEL